MDDLFDDPIADLLSEGSNDSFFENPKQTKPKKPSKPITNIFDFDDDNKKSAPKDIIPVESAMKQSFQKPQSPLKQAETKERRSSFDKDDINDLLSGHDTKKSKASVMNEILGLGSSEESKVFTFDDILKSSSLSKPKEAPEKKTLEIDKPIITLPMTKEPRRGRRGSASLDPLGLLDIAPRSPEIKKAPAENKPKTDFDMKISKSTGQLGISEDKPQTEIPTKASKSVSFLDTKESSLFSEFSAPRRREPVKKPINEQSDLPDWLRGSKSDSDPVAEPIATVVPVQTLPTMEAREVESTTFIKKSSDAEKPSKSAVIPNADQVDNTLLSGNVLDSVLKQHKLSSSSLDIQNSSLVLQQQESQLMIALQLKKYEQNLADMQRTQQDILMKQEQQFNLLIEKQFSKQQVMEENMRLQQERINQHIQLLLSQPVSSNLKHTLDEQQKKEDLLKDTFDENRAFYGDIISSLKQKHQEEIALLEESYKKQLGFLEMSLESTETRLKTEIENINTHYNAKIAEINAKHTETIEEYEAKIKTINENNEALMQEIKENYNELVKEIKNEYKLMIEDINRNKSRDEEVISNAGVFTDKLNTSIEILKNNTEVVSQMQMTIKDEKNFFSDLKEGTLSAKEQEIKMMQASLEKQRLASDTERAQLLALIKTLEMRLVEQTQAAREERWTLQQATATMAARALAMDKEIDYIKNNLDMERDQLKNLREAHLAEKENIMLQLTEEKLAIATEKSRLETSAKLNQSYDINRSKAEIEAALQVAREATELTDRERENLCRKQCELETLKRTLLDRERKLHMREQELENVSKMADQKYKDGERALLEARMVERQCADRLKDVQRHSSALASREKKLAEEKIALSKERLAIHNTVAENKCSLCKVDGYQNVDNSIHDDNLVEQDQSDSYKVQDLELIRLKYELDDTIPTSIREND